MSAKIIALHREIKLKRERQRRLYGSRQRPSLAALRVSELSRLFRYRYGLTLPLDDAGFEDAQIMAHHLAGLIGDPRKRIAGWLKLMMPSLSLRRAETIIETVIHRPRRWRAETLGKLMGLTEAERSSLRITTIGAIDVTKAQRLAKRKERARARAKELRAERRTMTREEYLNTALTKTMPWEAEGISRRTWERRRKLSQVPCAP
jgi:hypothetical protein